MTWGMEETGGVGRLRVGGEAAGGGLGGEQGNKDKERRRHTEDADSGSERGVASTAVWGGEENFALLEK